MSDEAQSAKDNVAAVVNMQRLAFEEGYKLAKDAFRNGHSSARAEHESLSSALGTATSQLMKIRNILGSVDYQNPNSWGMALEMIAEVLDFKR